MRATLSPTTTTRVMTVSPEIAMIPVRALIPA